MTIRFYCPRCNALIAFHSRHIGKRARCLTCGQVFIIPSRDDEKPEKVALPAEKAEPLPGFYKAVFADTWRIFIDPENATTLVFIAAAICFKFFLARAICCVNLITYLVVWGWLFGFYLNLIYETAYEIDKLPEIYIGTSVTFIWYALKPFMLFLFSLFFVQLPFIIALAFLRDLGVTASDLLQWAPGLHTIPQVLLLVGLFVFPVAILTLAVGEDITLLRPDYLIKPVCRAFVPYLTVAGLLFAFFLLEAHSKQYSGAGFLTTSLDLTLNLGAQMVAIVAMRSVGLFYRHYNCHFPW